MPPKCIMAINKSKNNETMKQSNKLLFKYFLNKQLSIKPTK